MESLYPIVAFVLMLPLVSVARGSATGARAKREELLRRKRSALLLLRDLEFDFLTGKLPEAEYLAARTDAEREAMEIIRELDDPDGGSIEEEIVTQRAALE
jgi:hypothetical protein